MRSSWQWVLKGCVHGLLGTATVLAMAIGFDYGIGPTYAAVPKISSVTEAVAPSSAAPAGLASPDADATDSQDAPAALSRPAIGSDPGQGYVRLPGHVLDALRDVEPLASQSRLGHNQSMSLTLTLNRDDQHGFERYLADVYDPQSPSYRHFLSQQALAQRFGPSRRSYSQVWGYLNHQGFQLIAGSKNRMTLSVRATRAQVERTFGLRIREYQIGGRQFHANDVDPAVPNTLASAIKGIQGFSDLDHPHRVVQTSSPGGPPGFCSTNAIRSQGPGQRISIKATCGEGAGPFLIPLCTVTALVGGVFVFAGGAALLGVSLVCLLPYVFPKESDLSSIRTLKSQRLADGQSATAGAGQKIGLLEFDSYNQSDVADFLALTGAPAPIGNLTEVAVSGGTQPGANQDEVLLDIDTVMTGAPGAQVTVYDAPFNGQAASYAALFNAMINGGVTIISNSWASCEDQISLAEAQSIDSVLQTAAASGISVFNGSGDTGSSCLDGSANTVAVPADSPNATAVGGSSPIFGPGLTYGSESWWDGTTSTPATGQGGFGVSKFFAQPGYQNGFTSATGRSVPDVVADADPANGMVICQANAGGCPTGSLYGGTSLATPEWAVYAALLNQSIGKNLGSFNQLLYPIANTQAFHNAAAMGSDFAHVGLGSPSIGNLKIALSHQTVGLPSSQVSQAIVLRPQNLVSSSSIPADGTTQGGVLVKLFDANGNIVSGKTVSLTASGGSAVITPSSGVSTASDGTVAFTITDLAAEALTLTATDTTDGIPLAQTTVVTFAPPPATGAAISANPPTVPADGQTPATIMVTLKDSLNRPSPGKTVSIADAGTHAVITGPNPGVTDANGQIQFSATDQVNETVTFTAVDVTDGNLPFPGSATVTYSGSTATACGVGVAPVAGAGYTITPYVTGLPAAATLFFGNANIGCPGGNNPIFTSAGAVLVSDFLTGSIYQTGLSGGTATSTDILSTLTPALGALVYGKDGSVYATLGNEGAQIVQVDPTSGAQLRVVASGLTCPAGLAVDPLSGDLFFDDECTGGGTDNASIFRVIDPANTNPSAPTSVVVYATLPTTPNGGMAFAPNGTLYAVSGYDGNTMAPVEQISGTNVATVTVTPVTGITSDFAVAIGTTNADGSAQSLIAEPAGNLSEIPIATPGAAMVLATGGPGVGVTGPDGCLYSAHYDTVYRIANSSGTCSFLPTSPAPSINLTPASVAPNPAQGSSQTFTATLTNVSPVAGVPVLFTVTGSNAQLNLIDTNANGIAAFTYTAALSGSDTVTATTTANGTPLTSNSVALTWTAGKHVTFLSLNNSPQGGTIAQPVNVVASLADVSASPAAVLAGQAVTFALGGSTCTATTNSAGTASCTITPSQAGVSTLTANFAGSSALAASARSVGFRVSAAPTGAPTVTISVSPTTIAAGGTATLTWSSTNATACTASGSWSGTQASSGTQTVTPATTGSYSYTLACTGNGGSASATAVLAATLVAVTVTAHSGGGAMSWPLLLLLGLLVMLRMGASSSARRAAGGTLLCLLWVLGAVGTARADQPAAGSAAAGSAASGASADWLDPLYVGIRVGGMPTRLHSADIDTGLADLGYGGIAASTDTSAIGGTLYVGYEFAPHADVEFGYTHRSAEAATLAGTIPSTANIAPLLQDTAGLIRSYGNIFSLSFRPRFEVAPRIMIDPRIGGFFWSTKVTAQSDGDRFDATHEGGGVTAGIGAAYRLWRGLELGIGVDYFHGSPSNNATLYGGSLEWRFGH
jgi:hypothetical protein